MLQVQENRIILAKQCNMDIGRNEEPFTPGAFPDDKEQDSITARCIVHHRRTIGTRKSGCGVKCAEG